MRGPVVNRLHLPKVVGVILQVPSCPCSRVGTGSPRTLRRPLYGALERQGWHSHAERGNDGASHGAGLGSEIVRLGSETTHRNSDLSNPNSNQEPRRGIALCHAPTYQGSPKSEFVGWAKQSLPIFESIRQ